MATPNRHSFRIVVQHINLNHRSSYRLIVYGNGQSFRPLEFDSLNHLLKALHSLIRDFDEGSVSIQKDAHDTYIAFTGDLELEDSDLSSLGLVRDSA